MSTYGEIVRQLRMKKGISQKELYTGIMSKSYAIRFEQGRHDISFYLLQLILERLTMEIDEFLYISNDYQASVTEQFYTEYGRRGNANDLQGLRNMRNYYAQQNQTPQISLHVAELTARLDQLRVFNSEGVFSKADLDLGALRTIHAYLDGVQTWTLFELRLLADTLDFMEYERKVDYFNSLLPSIDRYKGFERGHRVVCTLLINEIHELVMSRELESAAIFLNKLEEFITGVEEMFYRNASLFYRGLIQIGQGFSEQGENATSQAIWIFKTLGYNHQAHLFESLKRTFCDER